MNEEQARLYRDKLLSECQELLTTIGNHRLANKLLITVKAMLERTLEYKANRTRK